MSYVVTQRGVRFLGDSSRMIYHDLLYEVDGSEGCDIDRILREGTGVGFFPDKREQAKLEGYSPCPICNG